MDKTGNPQISVTNNILSGTSNEFKTNLLAL